MIVKKKLTSYDLLVVKKKNFNPDQKLFWKLMM